MQTLLSYGFRPFFLLGALYACALMLVWVPWFLGLAGPPSPYPPSVWHAHELLFGFVPAVIAGFLLTAVPNWTGRTPLSGWPLGTLVILWLSGRVAIAVAETIGEVSAALIAIAFPVVLLLVVGRELLAARNGRNFKVWLLFAALAVSAALFHYEFIDTGQPELATRMGVASAIGLLLLIASRVTPTFTRNWLRKHNPGAEPPAWGAIDTAAASIGGIALAAWATLPLLQTAGDEVSARMTVAGLCALSGIAHLVQQSRWQPLRTAREPLVLVLHAAFLFLSIGFLLQAAGLALDDDGFTSAALHCWTIGAIGTMTLAIMTRATRGHTGRSLTAPWGTTLLFLFIMSAALARMASAIWPDLTMSLLPAAGLAWVFAFAGFVILYANALVSPRR